VRLHPSIPLVRIVPDDTKFDFMRFRRISFPASALLSIFAICLFFFHGLNFGIDFIGGTLIEVQSKTGAADLGKMRTTLGGLGLGEVQLQQFGGPENVLIRVAQQPGGEEAREVGSSHLGHPEAGPDEQDGEGLPGDRHRGPGDREGQLRRHRGEPGAEEDSDTAPRQARGQNLGKHRTASRERNRHAQGNHHL